METAFQGRKINFQTLDLVNLCAVRMRNAKQRNDLKGASTVLASSSISLIFANETKQLTCRKIQLSAKIHPLKNENALKDW